MKKLFILIFVCLILGCNKASLRNADTSLQGNWTATEAAQYSGLIGNITLDTDPLVLIFADETVSYFLYTLNDPIDGEDAAYRLRRSKRNAGFTQEEVFTLTIEGVDYEVQFGDQTSDAEQNATRIRLVQDDSINNGGYLSMEFEKE